jgi:hypothetical protein
MSVTDPSPVTTPGAPPAPAVTYPSDYEELKARAQEYKNFREALAPYEDDILPIVQDEDTRKFWRSARETYQQRLAAQEPQLDPAMAKVRDEFKTALDPIVEYIGSERKAKEDSKKAAEEAAQRANVDYAQRLAAERPDLAEDNFAGIGMLAAYAANRGMSLEDAYKTAGSRFSAPPARKAPPTALRGEAAAPGVPGESRQEKATTLKGIRQRLADNLRAGMKG